MTFFVTREDLFAQAYRLQEGRIAYEPSDLAPADVRALTEAPPDEDLHHRLYEEVCGDVSSHG